MGLSRSAKKASCEQYGHKDFREVVKVRVFCGTTGEQVPPLYILVQQQGGHQRVRTVELSPAFIALLKGGAPSASLEEDDPVTRVPLPL